MSLQADILTLYQYVVCLYKHITPSMIFVHILFLFICRDILGWYEITEPHHHSILVQRMQLPFFLTKIENVKIGPQKVSEGSPGFKGAYQFKRLDGKVFKHEYHCSWCGSWHPLMVVGWWLHPELCSEEGSQPRGWEESKGKDLVTTSRGSTSDFIETTRDTWEMS